VWEEEEMATHVLHVGISEQEICACRAPSDSIGVSAGHKLTATAALAAGTRRRRIVALPRAAFAVLGGSAAKFVSIVPE